MSKFTGAVGLLALGLWATYACSSDEKSSASSSTAGGGGRAAVGGSRATGGSAVNPAGCPATQPAQGDTCSEQGLTCTYGAESCACVPAGFGGPQAGAGGQAPTLSFRCRTTADAGTTDGGVCDQGEACDPVGSTCTNADGATCTCTVRRGNQTYVCDDGGGGVGPGGRGNAGTAG
jgi:hypothetical protein